MTSATSTGVHTLQMAADVPPLQVAVVAYPDLTVLDLVGPHAVFSTTAESHVVAATVDPVAGDAGLSIVPTTTYADCPVDLDVLLVPGGRGSLAAMQDPELLQFLRDRADTARYVTAVCSGSLVLGAAGLLRGHRATTHWASHDALAEFEGVTPVKARVVVDGNRVTGGGVTAGIDFGLTLLALLRGDDVARLNQLLMEYDPQPPFDAGSEQAAGPELATAASRLMGPFRDDIAEAARRSPGAARAR